MDADILTLETLHLHRYFIKVPLKLYFSYYLLIKLKNNESSKKVFSMKSMHGDLVFTSLNTLMLD